MNWFNRRQLIDWNSSSGSSACRMGVELVPMAADSLCTTAAPTTLFRLNVICVACPQTCLKRRSCLFSLPVVRGCAQVGNYLCCGSGGWVVSWWVDMGPQLGERLAVRCSPFMPAWTAIPERDPLAKESGPVECATSGYSRRCWGLSTAGSVGPFRLARLGGIRRADGR